MTDQRGTDQYGYAAFDGNYYWVRGTNRDDVKILEYSDRLKIYQLRQCYRCRAGVTNSPIAEPTRAPVMTSVG